MLGITCSARDLPLRQSASSDAPQVAGNLIARITANRAFSHGLGPMRTCGDVRFHAGVKGIADITSALVAGRRWVLRLQRRSVRPQNPVTLHTGAGGSIWRWSTLRACPQATSRPQRWHAWRALHSNHELWASRPRSPATGLRASGGYRVRLADTACGRPRHSPSDRPLNLFQTFGSWASTWPVRQRLSACWPNTNAASFSSVVLVKWRVLSPPKTSLDRMRRAVSELRFGRSGEPAGPLPSKCRMNRRCQWVSGKLGTHGQQLLSAAASRAPSPPACRCFRGRERLSSWSRFPSDDLELVGESSLPIRRQKTQDPMRQPNSSKLRNRHTRKRACGDG